MSVVRDAAIKLFGRNIPVREIPSPADSDSPAATDKFRKANKAEVDNPVARSGKDFPSNTEDGRENNELEGNHIPAVDQVLKRPDKILPCPRCNSLDTKFCYFNNYNVNQPRHFCKNCHRYWTAGGTMRNVPVGAGRRKNKHPSTPFHQAVVPSVGLLATQPEALNSANHHLSCVGLPAPSRPVQGIGEVLKFGKDVHLCESMTASLILRDPAISAYTSSTAVGNDGEEPSSSGCFSTTTTVHENELRETQIEQIGLQGSYDRFTSEHPVQCYPGTPWDYPWNTMMFRPNNNNSNGINTDSPLMMAVSSFCTPSATIPFAPASYWGCILSWNGMKWNIPLVATTGTGCLSPSSSASNNCSGNNSPTLGKHSRDASLHAEEKTEQSLWVPKTLRLDDPDEAAKSSIWDTLGIKPDNIQLIKKGSVLKGFQSNPKSPSCTSDPDVDQVLQANPAALSRSQTFQENALGFISSEDSYGQNWTIYDLCHQQQSHYYI